MPESNLVKFSFPELTDELKRTNLWNLLKLFGPGALIASVTVGTGETLFSPRLGAIFGYSMLWVITASVILKGIQVYVGARYLVLTGEHPVKAWTRFPGPRAWFPILLAAIIIVSLPPWIAAIADALANLCMWITGVGGESEWARTIWGSSFLIGVAILTQLQTYGVIERVSTVILSLKVVFVLMAVVVVQPDWRASLWHALVPSLSRYDPAVVDRYPEFAQRSIALEIATFAGAIGSGIHDYVGYLGMMREKGWGALGSKPGDIGPESLPTQSEQIRLGRRWLRAPLFDTLFSFLSVFLITACFMMLGAALLHPQMLVPTDRDLYSAQAQFLAVIHPSLVIIYKLGIFVALFGVIYGIFEVWGHTIYELLHAISAKIQTTHRRPLRTLVTLYACMGGLFVLWTGMKTIGLVSIVSPLTGILGCGIWCLAMTWVDRRFLPDAYRMKGFLLGGTIAAGMIMTLFGVYVAVAR